MLRVSHSAAAAATTNAASIASASLFQTHFKTNNVRNRSSSVAFASPSIPPPPPISMPVWSLSSPLLVSDNSKLPDVGVTTKSTTSMNIVTFATPVSVAPPKLWAISLYKNTLTRDAFCSSGIGILQLLNPQQKSLVPLLGKRSGHEEGYSKSDECESVGYKWVTGNGCNLLMMDNDGDASTSSSIISKEDRSALESIQLIPECATYILVKLLPQPMIDAGDHEIGLCEVLGTGKWDDTAKQVILQKSPNGQSEPMAPTPLDETSALYTSLLRKEGII